MTKSFDNHSHAIKTDQHPELPIDPDVVQPGRYRWPPHFTPELLLLVFVGGMLGTLLRYWVGTIVHPWYGFPVATLLINLTGAGFVARNFGAARQG